MANYQRAAERAARRYGLNPRIFKRMIRQESGFREGVTSPAGAQDIAQFMPATAKQYGVTLGDNRVADDLDGAARYLRDNLNKYGSYHAALSVYNSGRPDAYKDPSFAGGQTYNYVRGILKGVKDGGGGGGEGPSAAPRGPSYRTVPGVDNSATRAQLMQQYFSRSHDPDALLQLKGDLEGAADVPSRQVRVRGPVSAPAKATGQAFVAAVTQEAEHINQAHVGYQWGGGHASRQPRGSKVTPLDCSGAVSRVLGINPRVSGQFEKWGKPGKGAVTVYANGRHVLLEINGHFWGTSATNPGGGPGWIKRKDIPPGYLKNFVARHA